MNDKGIEVVTVYRGKDSATYLLSEFQELGDKATPIAVRQYPGDSKPYRKIELKDTDAIAIEKVDQSLPTDTGKWDVKALQKLLQSTNGEREA